MLISEELEKTLNRAFAEAKTRRHEYVSLEHLLLALTHDQVAGEILSSCGADIDELRNDLTDFLDSQMPEMPVDYDAEPQYTLGFQFVLQVSAAHVRSSGKKQMDGGNVLAALFREKESHAAYFLDKQGITRLDVLRFISHGIAKAVGGAEPGITPAEADEEGALRDPLANFCTNLNEKARKGLIDPLIGRDDEIDRMIHVLARRRKNNPILVGDAGVGKTAIVEGLARRIVEGKVPKPLRHFEIFRLDMAGMLAGTKFRGEFEERIKAVVQRLSADPHNVVFIDEIHTIIGAGAVSGGALDASNILKPALAGGELKCIGTTTFKEYRQVFEKDHALARRFQKIEVDEPSVEDAVKILQGLRERYEAFHGVSYSDASLRTAAELSAKHMTDRRLPDKAIDVMDETGAELKLRRDGKQIEEESAPPKVTSRHIEQMVSRIAKVPTQTVQTDDRKRLETLERDLRFLIFGQDQAVEQVTKAIQLARAGLGEPDKPVGSFLFAGPTGVGKTELARQLALLLGISFLRFDMSEYMEEHTVSRLIGSPPGYVGFEQGGQLTEAVYRNPHAVLLLDEIEKAHEKIFNILLQVMDYATLTDNTGRKADFRNVILIMTSNAGAREGAQRQVGFAAGGEADPTRSKGAIDRVFSPEFRNRLTQVVQFNGLSMPIVERIVQKLVAELEERLRSKNVTLNLEDSAQRYLAEKGFDPVYGARNVKRVIEQEIAHALSPEILFGRLSKGGRVTLRSDGEKLVFEFETESQIA